MQVGYHVVRIALDPLGAPVSALVDCQEHERCSAGAVLDVGPFDSLADVCGRVTDAVDRQLTLW